MRVPELKLEDVKPTNLDEEDMEFEAQVTELNRMFREATVREFIASEEAERRRTGSGCHRRMRGQERSKVY